MRWPLTVTLWNNPLSKSANDHFVFSAQVAQLLSQRQWRPGSNLHRRGQSITESMKLVLPYTPRSDQGLNIHHCIWQYVSHDFDNISFYFLLIYTMTFSKMDGRLHLKYFIIWRGNPCAAVNRNTNNTKQYSEILGKSIWTFFFFKSF